MSTESVRINPLDIIFSRDNIEDKTKGKGLCGLQNLGNSCYMNSIIQCLSNTNWLRHFLLLDEFKEFNQEEKPHKIMLLELNKLIRALWFQNAVVSPKSFFNYLGLLSVKLGSGQFAGHNQNDSSELLVFILDLLNESMASNIPLVENPNQPRIIWERIFKNSWSPIVDAFYNQSHTQITCENCKFCSVSYDPMVILHLPINGTTLEECLQNYSNEELLSGDNAYYCDKCENRSDAIRKDGIWNTADHLIITLKRFGSDGSKNNALITYPIGQLDMTPYLKSGDSRKYELYAVSNHLGGSIHGGHYTSYVKNAGSWYEYNDSMVNTATQENIVSPNSYVLFYKLI